MLIYICRDMDSDSTAKSAYGRWAVAPGQSTRKLHHYLIDRLQGATPAGVVEEVKELVRGEACLVGE